MFERHAPVCKLLHCLDHHLLERLGIFFGGGTAIALRLHEFRVSTDIDLFCRDDNALYAARHIAVEEGAENFFSQDVTVTTQRVDRNGRKLFVTAGETEVKCEIFNLALFPIMGERTGLFPVPTLTPYELFTAKLSSNANRFMDSSTKNKDIIDLGAMLNAWGEMPRAVWETAYSKYGQADIDGAFRKATARLLSRKELRMTEDCLGISHADTKLIAKALVAECRRMESRPPGLSETDIVGPSL